MTPQQFRVLALSFPGVIEAPHFDRAAFKIVNKRIFATLHEASKTANIMLSVADQKAFCSFEKKIAYPVPNKWGLGGATTFEIHNAEPEFVQTALEAAYQGVLKTKIKIRPKKGSETKHTPVASLLKITTNKEIDNFLRQYDEQVLNHVLKLREVLLANLPNIIEQLDIPTRMIAYCYGQKYIDMICTIIPSRKGLKLGFSYGVDLPDSNHLLSGTGKISRYVEISEKEISSPALKKLITSALKAYKSRTKKRTKT